VPCVVTPHEAAAAERLEFWQDIAGRGFVPLDVFLPNGAVARGDPVRRHDWFGRRRGDRRRGEPRRRQRSVRG